MDDLNRALVKLSLPKIPEIHIQANAEYYNQSKMGVNARCSGEHYGNLRATILDNNEQLEKDFKWVKRQVERKINEPNPGTINIGCVCKDGRKKSVSLCRIIVEILKRLGEHSVHGPVHIHEYNKEEDQCSSTCEQCDLKYLDKQELYTQALNLWKQVR